MDFASLSDMESIQGGLDPSGATGGFADNSDPSQGDSDYTVTGTPTEFRTVQNYTQARGATNTNPFPDSIFSRIFGAENVDYTGMGIDVAGINNLRYRQAMGLPSLTTGQDFKMGDFYIGQPTMEGTVKEVPGGGIMNMIPGISTISNFLGRNRGLPEGSDAFKEAMADSKKPSFQPITDIIDSFTRGVGGLKNIFDTEETDTNPMSMLEAGVRKEVPEFDYGEIPSGFTFGSMPQNVGIVTMAPENKTEADMAVTDALQLVPSEFQDVPTDLGSGIRIAPGSGENRFKFTTSTGANLPGLNPLGNVFDILDARDLEKEISRLSDEEREFLANRTNIIS